MTFDFIVNVTLVAMMATLAGAGCSGSIPSMSGAPAPTGSARFGTWLRVTTVYDGSKLQLATIDVVELKKQKETNVDVIYDDKLINLNTITKEELMTVVDGAREEKVSLAYRDDSNGADTAIIKDNYIFYFLGAEMVKILFGPGKICINRDPNKIIHIDTSWSLSQVEEVLGPATSKNLPGINPSTR